MRKEERVVGRGRSRRSDGEGGAALTLSRAELTLLLEGIDLKEARKRPRWYRHEAAAAMDR